MMIWSRLKSWRPQRLGSVEVPSGTTGIVLTVPSEGTVLGSLAGSTFTHDDVWPSLVSVESGVEHTFPSFMRETGDDYAPSRSASRTFGRTPNGS